MGKLEELMSDEETKAEIESDLSEWAKSQGYKAPDEIEGLVKKKDELLSKISKLNRDQTTEEQRRILEAINELGVESADELVTALSKKGSGDELERKLKRLQKEAEENKALYETERKQRISYAKDNAIIQALKEAGIKDSAFDMAFAYFDRIADVEESDGKVKVIAKDKEGLGPSIDSFIAEWSKTDAAKDYVRKPANKGAGVSGENGDSRGVTGKTMTLEAFGNLTPKDQAAFVNDGGQITAEG
jgi:hypothetical protein